MIFEVKISPIKEAERFKVRYAKIGRNAMSVPLPKEFKNPKMLKVSVLISLKDPLVELSPRGALFILGRNKKTKMRAIRKRISIE
jgi:hypothetical protein